MYCGRSLLTFYRFLLLCFYRNKKKKFMFFYLRSTAVQAEDTYTSPLIFFWANAFLLELYYCFMRAGLMCKVTTLTKNDLLWTNVVSPTNSSIAHLFRPSWGCHVTSTKLCN
jgi:hypothetical protein